MDFSKIEEVREESPEDKERMVFYYNREERLKKAPAIVREFHTKTAKDFKPGLFKALVKTRGNKLMLITLLVCFAVVVFLGFFYKKNEAVINGIPLNLSAFSFEENVYVSLCFENPEKQYKTSGPVPAGVEFLFLDADRQPVEIQNMTHIYEGKESFLRTAFHDYDIFFIKAVAVIQNKTVELTTAVEKR